MPKRPDAIVKRLSSRGYTVQTGAELADAKKQPPGSEFIVARNPDSASALPFLIRIPIEGGIWLKSRDTWPQAARVYCHRADRPNPASLEILERVPVEVCVRRGPAIDLVLRRAAKNRAQFIFTRQRGRPAIFWQTARAAAAAHPGLRLPVHRLPDHSLLVLVDTREKRPYQFKADKIETAAGALAAGDYGVRANGQLIAAVERKTIDGFRNALSDGSLAFAMAHLSALRAAAVVVEATYADVLRSKFTAPGWMDELIARLQARYPSVPIVFADSRKLAEHWTARFLAAAAAEFSAPALPLDNPPRT